MRIKIEDLKHMQDLFTVGDLEVKTYVSVLTKMAMIDALVETLVQEDETGMYVVNSIDKEVKAKVAAVALYTNIELTDNDYLNYDIIKSTRLLEQLMDMIQDNYHSELNDIKVFYDMLDRRIDDKLAENSMNRILAIRSKEVIDAIQRTMSHVDAMLDKGDPNTIAKHLSKGVEMIAKKLPDFSKFDIEKAAQNFKVK